MKPKGTIYRNSANNIHGETRLALTEAEKKSFKKKRLIGAVLASLSITSLLFFYGPSLMLDLEVVQSRLTRSVDPDRHQTSTVFAAETTESDNSENQENTEVAENENIEVNEFRLNIPAINATSNVVYDVDPFNRGQYLAALQKGIAHASTSSLPGQGKRVYLFAHSTNSPLNFNQYNAVFYQLRLLKEGDEVISILNGEEHKYVVSEKHIVDADDTHWLTETEDRDQLVLQTCDPPGTTLRRLLVVAEKV